MQGLEAINNVLSGAMALACSAIGLFFLRFWRKSRDRLFLMFAVAFWILGVNRLALSMLAVEDEGRTYLYVVRFFAFLLILIAIVDKNRKSGSGAAR